MGGEIGKKAIVDKQRKAEEKKSKLNRKKDRLCHDTSAGGMYQEAGFFSTMTAPEEV
jgi:hypothetical protein